MMAPHKESCGRPHTAPAYFAPQVSDILARNDRAFAHHFVDFMGTPADEQDIWKIKLVTLCPGGAYDQVAGAETKNPVPEKVGALLLEGHARRVVILLAFPEALPHLQLARFEN